MSTTGETGTTGVASGASGVAGVAGDEDWRWIVAADPAFYLDEPSAAGAVGEAR